MLACRRVGEDGRFLWIAEQALCAPLPEGCREMEDHLGNTFYLFTDDSGEVTTGWEHPYDEFYRDLFAGLKVLPAAPQPAPWHACMTALEEHI